MDHHLGTPLTGCSSTHLPLVGFVALWTPAMIAASYCWSHGEYYDYGWFVPPAALFLLVRRWAELRGPIVLPRRRGWIGLAAIWLLWVLALRILGYADPSWRLPMGLLGMTAALGGHGLIGATRGWRNSARFVWITLFCLSALPWPSVVESWIIRHLTQAIMVAVTEVFQLFGKPVEALGDRLQWNGITVEVTDGCSGVRSFQSFVMATWFFAEIQRLRMRQALVLMMGACGAAFLVNVARTHALASIRFEYGESAFARAHDWLGLAAFAASAVFFFVLSGKLSDTPRRRLVTSIVTRSARTDSEEGSVGL